VTTNSSIATVEGTAAPICNLARKLLAFGVDPAWHLSIWRGETKCFHDVPEADIQARASAMRR